MNDILVVQGIEGYEKDGIVYLRLETVARGLGFTKTEIKNGIKYTSIRWSRVDEYLTEIGFRPKVGEGENFPTNGERPEFIPENVFYRLAMKAKNEVAEAFQSKVAEEIIPTLRRTGSYSIHKDNPALPSGVLEGAKLIFETAGIKDNQLTLAMDKVYKSYTGRSALAAGEIQIEAPTKRQLLTPTEIAIRFADMTARKINDILAGAGYQHKISDKWEPLEPGLPYAVMLDTNKKHSDGTPVRQLKWDSSIISQVAHLIRKEC